MEFVPGAHDSRAQLHIVGIERRQFSGGLGDAHEAIYLTVRLDPLLERLQLPMNAEKTRCCRVPEEPMTFLGYRIGRNYRPGTGTAYIGTRPSRESVQSICRRISALTTRRDLQLPSGMMVTRLNRLLTGWANCFILGQVGPAYAAIDQHATRRLRRWLGRKHQVRSGKNVRFSSESRMREIRTSGSTSGDWKRSHGEE